MTVLDYGFREGTVACCINGIDAKLASSQPPKPVQCSCVQELIGQFPDGFFANEGASQWSRQVRWIDVEGTNGDIVEFFLNLIKSREQTAFHMIMDPKQPSMALALDTDSGTNVMVNTIKGKLTDEAQGLLEAESGQLCACTDVVEDEATSYLCRLEDGRRHSTLITIQGGMEDNIFD